MPRRWYDPYATSPVNRELAWGQRVQHWGPRDWRDLWQALAAVPLGARGYVWARLLWRVARDRWAGRDVSDDWGL